MKTRDHYFDNAKFILIIFVAIAHFIEPVRDAYDSMKPLHGIIYYFHMPSFLMITGYFSRSYIKKDGTYNVIRLAKGIIYYLLINLCIYTICRALNVETTLHLMNPYGGTWYFLALIQYALIIPILANAKRSLILPLSVVIALLIGIDKSAGTFFNLSRFFVFAPFFIFGYYYDLKEIANINKKWVKIGAVILFVAMYVFISLSLKAPIHKFIGGSKSYQSMGTPYLGILYRLVWYIITFLLSLSFLSLVPKRKMFFSTLGQRTLQIYFFHTLMYYFYSKLKIGIGWTESISMYPVICITGSILSIFLLSHKLFGLPFLLIDRLFRTEKKKNLK